MRVCLGGTFHPFHVGHEALLQAAIEGADAVFVGITDGPLAKRSRPMPEWQERAQAVGAFLKALHYTGEVRIEPLRDAAGPANSEPFDVIVASPETAVGAERINATRRAASLPELVVRLVPHVLGEDRLPVSATAIFEDRIDRSGRRLRPTRVAVGSQNPVKVAAVAKEMQRILGSEVDVEGVGVSSDVPEQPQADHTLEGAQNRARAALQAMPEADYAVGVEAGLVQFPGDEASADVQSCVVLDRNGRETNGWGPGFHYPEWVRRRAESGEMISDILGPVAKDPRIGGTTGAIGYLSDGLMDRTELTEVAVLMAFVPRIRPSLYSDLPA